jgi:hypothetical protein
MNDEPLAQLASLHERLLAFVDGWRSLPVELGDLADACTAGLEESAGHLADVIDSRTQPPKRGQAA